MDDAVIVGGFERFGDLPRDRQCFVDRNRSARDSLRQVLAFDEFHHQCSDTARLFQSVNVRDVRVIQRCEHLRFATESGEAIGIVGNGGKQDLDRNVAIQLRVAGAIDLTHPARTERGEDLERTETGAGNQGDAGSIAVISGPPASG